MLNKSNRVAIIGAGPSGMAALRAFTAAQAAGAEIPEIVCYEKQDDWGGQWNYTWRTGTDGYGEPVHSSMYRNLWSNGPKEALEFAEYTFDEHFQRPISSYPPRAVLWDYINGRAEQSGVKKLVRFANVVRRVDFDDSAQQFTVIVDDLKNKTTQIEIFDQVIVSTGHFSFPNVPDIAGIESFSGEVIHAHEFRGAERFAGQRLLLIGGSYSAEDIGIQCHKMGARQVTMSYRSQPQGFAWPAGVDEKPQVASIDGRVATFIDGSSREFDAVILCTGYLHHYPFLPSDLHLESPNNLYPEGLYRGVTWHENPRLHYLGAQDQWFTFNMFDAQAWFVRDLILGRVELPSADERAAHMQDWLEAYRRVDDDPAAVQFQADYIRDLIDQTDYPMFDLDEVVRIFLAWKADKKRNIVTYRDGVYTSVMTGTTSIVHHTPWLAELDDSAERYLSIQPTPIEVREPVK